MADFTVIMPRLAWTSRTTAVLLLKGFGDARAQVDGVADEALVAGLQGFHERFAAVSAAVVDRDGAAIERLAGGVGQFRGVGGMRRAVVGIDQQFAPLDGLLEEGQHGRFVLADGDGLGDAVFEQLAEFARGSAGDDGAGGDWP
jgi:hypothetical protein